MCSVYVYFERESYMQVFDTTTQNNIDFQEIEMKEKMQCLACS